MAEKGVQKDLRSRRACLGPPVPLFSAIFSHLRDDFAFLQENVPLLLIFKIPKILDLLNLSYSNFSIFENF